MYARPSSVGAGAGAGAGAAAAAVLVLVLVLTAHLPLLLLLLAPAQAMVMNAVRMNPLKRLGVQVEGVGRAAVTNRGWRRSSLSLTLSFEEGDSAAPLAPHANLDSRRRPRFSAGTRFPDRHLSCVQKVATNKVVLLFAHTKR